MLLVAVVVVSLHNDGRGVVWWSLESRLENTHRSSAIAVDDAHATREPVMSLIWGPLEQPAVSFVSSGACL